MSYGVDGADLYRRAVAYADSILKGGNPGELPVQAPDKYELIINLKTAKALGLERAADVARPRRRGDRMRRREVITPLGGAAAVRRLDCRLTFVRSARLASQVLGGAKRLRCQSRTLSDRARR